MWQMYSWQSVDKLTQYNSTIFLLIFFFTLYFNSKQLGVLITQCCVHSLTMLSCGSDTEVCPTDDVRMSSCSHC